MLQEMIEIERQEQDYYREQALLEEQKTQETKRRNKKALIDELVIASCNSILFYHSLICTVDFAL